MWLTLRVHNRKHAERTRSAYQLSRRPTKNQKGKYGQNMSLQRHIRKGALIHHTRAVWAGRVWVSNATSPAGQPKPKVKEQALPFSFKCRNSKHSKCGHTRKKKSVLNLHSGQLFRKEVVATTMSNYEILSIIQMSSL